jgi:uncharacterized protein (DUF3820 family)
MERYTEYMHTKMIYGKYKGIFIKDIPTDYIKWAVMNIRDRGMATMFSVELQRREPKLKK